MKHRPTGQASPIRSLGTGATNINDGSSLCWAISLQQLLPFSHPRYDGVEFDGDETVYGVSCADRVSTATVMEIIHDYCLTTDVVDSQGLAIDGGLVLPAVVVHGDNDQMYVAPCIPSRLNAAVSSANPQPTFVLQEDFSLRQVRLEFAGQMWTSDEWEAVRAAIREHVAMLDEGGMPESVAGTLESAILSIASHTGGPAVGEGATREVVE